MKNTTPPLQVIAYKKNQPVNYVNSVVRINLSKEKINCIKPFDMNDYARLIFHDFG